MAYKKIDGFRSRAVYYTDQKTYNKVVQMQEMFNLRTRNNVIDMAINELYERLKNEKRIL